MKNSISIFLAILLSASLGMSQKNSQWRGPERDGIYPEKNLLKSWPASGLKLLWKTDILGEGYSSASVTDEAVYTSGMIDQKGYVFKFDHKGKLLWKAEYAGEWFENYPGTRSTPAVYDGLVYVMSGKGIAVCLDAANGKKIWEVDLLNKFNGENIRWGVTEAPLIFDEKVIFQPGGKDVTVVALNRQTGQTIWKSKTNGEKTAYCSPLLIKLAKRKLIVTHTESHIVGIDAADGKFLWQHSQPNQWSVHANTPIYSDGQIFAFSGYGKGSVMIKLASDGTSVSELWRKENFDSRMGGAVLVDGYIYGSGDKAREWRCVDWKTGEEKYASKEVGKGVVIYADGMLYMYSDRGEMAIAKADPSGFKVSGKFKVTLGSNQHWAHPVINKGKLYIRHGDTLMVYDISA